jgi:acetyl-CoA C-acetyltransferase
MTKAAIVGWAHTPFGKLEEPDVESLIARVSGEALAHAGVEAGDVEAITVGVFNNGFSRQGFEGALVATQMPELAHVPSTHVENACATGSAALYAALDFIEAGRGKIALVVGAEKMTATPGAQISDILLTACYRKE